MEGDDGKTIVAIIRGLRDAGLAFTFLSGTPQNSPKVRARVPLSRSSVETNTEYTNRNTSAQIEDAHYTSSYQVAHCRYTPSSPPHHTPEFPVQRRAPSYSKGNFKQVGSYGCKQTSTECRQLINRGSFCRSLSRSLRTDSFMDSLRRYPISEQTVSSELIQRLLSNTQAKHLSRKISQSKRALASRPSRVKNKKSSKLVDTKSIQTYTRMYNEGSVKPRSKSRRNETRPELDQLSESYNYLNVSSSVRRSYAGPCSEVRYLNDIKKYIKQTIRQFVSQGPPVCCPKTQSRYEEHRRLFHKQTDNTTNRVEGVSEAISTEPIVASPTAEETTMTDIVRKLRDTCTGTTSSVGVCPKSLTRYQTHRKQNHGEMTDDLEAETKEKAAAPDYCKPPPGTKRSRSCSPFGRPCICEDKATAPLTTPGISVSGQSIADWLENNPEKMRKRGLVGKDKKEMKSDSDIEADIKDIDVKETIVAEDTIAGEEIDLSSKERARLNKIKMDDIKPKIGVNKATMPTSSNSSLIDGVKPKFQARYGGEGLDKKYRKSVDFIPESGARMSPQQSQQFMTDKLGHVKSESKQRKRWDQMNQNERNQFEQNENNLMEHNERNQIEQNERIKIEQNERDQIKQSAINQIDQKGRNLHQQNKWDQIERNEMNQFEQNERYQIDQKGRNLEQQHKWNQIEENESNQIKLNERNKIYSTSSKSTDLMSISLSNLSSQEKQKLESQMNKTILDFNKGITGEESAEMQSKRKIDVMQLAENLIGKMTNFYGQARDEKVTGEILRYLEKQEFDTDESIKDMGMRLKHRLGMIDFETVRPGSSGNKKDDVRLRRKSDISFYDTIARSLASDKMTKEAVDKWVTTLDLSKTDDAILSEAKANLAKTLLNEVINADKVSARKVDEIFQNTTCKFLEEIPEHPYVTEDIEVLAKSLQDTLFKVSGKLTTATDKRNAADVLLDDIANWVKNLPQESDTPEEEAEKTRQQLESKLIHKIGELNMNPEVVNDDFMFEDILGDEVDNLLVDIPGENVKNNQPKLKKDFLDIVKKARQRIREENAGQIYKQELRETIERTLPPFDLPPDGKALFEVLKDDMADAFINMHYVGNDQREINRLKNKINDEIYQFSCKYLKRCPALPLDTSTLTEKLSNTMENVAVPQNKSFTNEVRLVKMKQEISNWAKELLPLKEQNGKDKLQMNKMMSVLSKKLHDIENTIQLIPYGEYNEKMKKEITKFLEKLPLSTDSPEDLNQFAETLMKNLRDTEESRRLNASNRHSTKPVDSCSCNSLSMPPSTLSKKDQEHLDRIRQRTPQTNTGISINDMSETCLADAGSQTETKNSSFCIRAPVHNHCLAQRSSCAQTPYTRMLTVGSQMSNNAIVSNNCWDSIDESYMQPPRVASPCPSIPRPCGAISQRLQRSPESCGSCIPAGQKPHATMPGPSYPSQNQFVSQNQFISRRCSQARPSGPLTPYPRPECQLTYRPTPCRPLPCKTATCRPAACRLAPSKPEDLLTQAGIQCSVPDLSSPYSPLSDQSNTSSQENQSRTCQLPRNAGPHLMRPYDQLPGRSERNHQRTKLACQRSQYCPPSLPCFAQEPSNQMTIRDIPNSPYNICTGPVSRTQRSRRLHHENRPKTCVPSRPSPCQGPSRQTMNPVPFGPPQMPWPRNSRPCYINAVSPRLREDCEAGPSCSFQKRVTHLGSFDQIRPQPCMLRIHDWTNQKAADANQNWQLDRSGNSSDEGPQCRSKQTCGRYSGRWKLSHLSNDESMNSCSKCRGVHCPYPSYLFFG